MNHANTSDATINSAVTVAAHPNLDENAETAVDITKAVDLDSATGSDTDPEMKWSQRVVSYHTKSCIIEMN